MLTCGYSSAHIISVKIVLVASVCCALLKKKKTLNLITYTVTVKT